jgi:uncharacterized Rmd1/YagE family protein
MQDAELVKTGGDKIFVKAFDIASSYDLHKAREILEQEPSARMVKPDPLLVQLEENKMLVVFRYGAIVFFNVQPREIQRLTDRLRPSAIRENKISSEDDFLLYITTQQKKPEGTSEWYIKEFNRDIALLVGVVLSRSVSLEYYEKLVADALEQFQQTISALATKGWIPHRQREAFKHVGFALSVEHDLAYDVAILDDPDALCDGGSRVELLYTRLKREFELEDRIRVIQQKISFISRFSTFVLSRLDSQRAMYLEWIIILLILSEILIAFALR